MSARVGTGGRGGRSRITTEEWTRRARACHGGRYDYSGSIYTGSLDPIDVRCPAHGVFTLRASAHLEAGKRPGSGCPACAIETVRGARRAVHARAFPVRARAVHGDAYGYDEIDYVDDATPVSILCPEHGRFERTPRQHLRGAGCGACAARAHREGLRRDGRAAFETRARAVHGERFDYSKVVYRTMRDKVTIGCPEGHDFEQTPAHHLACRGCPVCTERALTTERFVARAVALHGERYDYASTRYVRRDVEVRVRCPRHGAFRVLAREHLDGLGCPACLEATSAHRVLDDARRWLDAHGFVHGPAAGELDAARPDYPIEVPDARLVIDCAIEVPCRTDGDPGAAGRLEARRRLDRARMDWAFDNGRTLVRLPRSGDGLTAAVLACALLGERASGSVVACILAPRQRPDGR